MTRTSHILVALLCLLACFACDEKKGPALPATSGAGAPPAPVIPTLAEVGAKLAALETAPAASGPSGTGSLRALHEAALGPKETGAITAIAVEEGDRVKKGQVVFRIDAAQADLAVEQAKAAQSAADVQLATANLDFGRTKALRERGSVPPDVFDQAKARVDAASSGVAQAKVLVALAQRRVANMVVSAPFDGMVTERRMNVGETATLMPPSVVLVIQDREVLELRARLPESALQHVREGSDITARFPSLGETRRVRIKRISPTVDARSRTIEVIADVANPDHRLLSGMLAEVSYGDEQAVSAPKGGLPAAAAVRVAQEEHDATR
jgi:RND family efflux transporter MFP subunit